MSEKTKIPVWHSVTSSQIERIAYDAEAKILYVQFKAGPGKVGSVYAYADVIEGVFEKFKEAESAGKFLGAHIKPVYTNFRRITDKAEFHVLTGRCLDDKENVGDCGNADCECCHPKAIQSSADSQIE